MTRRTLAAALLALGLVYAPTSSWAEDELVGKPAADETEPSEDEDEDASEGDDAPEDEEDPADGESEEAPSKRSKGKADDEAPSGDEEASTSKESKSPARYADRRATSGLGFELRVGGLATLRRMNFSGTEDSILHSPGPYFGGALEGSQHILSWGKANAALLIEGEGGFGSARDSEVEPALGRPLITEYAYAYASVVVEKPLAPDLDLRIGIGGGGKSFTVEPNPDYTGHRYLSLLTSFAVTKWFANTWRFAGGVAFYPGVDTNQSARGYGSARSFGGRAEAGAVWRFYQPEENDLFGTAELGARFTYSRFRTAMPETQAVGDLGGTDDSHQQLALMLGYYL